MIGNNEMQLNSGTMCEIVQYWLDNKFLNKDSFSPRVTSVKGRDTGHNHVFDIVLEAKVPNGV